MNLGQSLFRRTFDYNLYLILCETKFNIIKMVLDVTNLVTANEKCICNATFCCKSIDLRSPRLEPITT